MQATTVSPGAVDRSGPAGHPVLRWGREHPFAACLGVSVLLAILSGIVWPTIPSYDPFAWVVWGHEVTSDVPFFIGNANSWKPFPFLFTLVWGVFGKAAAPWLWVVTARTGAFATIFAMIRLSRKLCARAGLPAWAAWVAAFIGFAGIVLSDPQSPWSYYFFRGTSEVLLIGVWLWAVDLLFDRRHVAAFMLVAVEGEMRPEAWPILLLYGLYLLWREWGAELREWRATRRWGGFHWRARRLTGWVLLGWLLQPFGWFVPPWISTGHPFQAATNASDYNGDLGTDWLSTVVHRGLSLQPVASLVAAGVIVVIALVRVRGLALLWRRPLEIWRSLSSDGSELPLVLALGFGTALWWAIVIGETWDHYPGLQRFYLPGAAMACVLSGLAVVQIAVWIGRFASARLAALGARFAAGSVAVATSVAALCIAAVVVPSAIHYRYRWDYVKEQEPRAQAAYLTIQWLGRSIDELGGRSKVLPCSGSVITINHSMQTAMAWELGTNMGPVQTVLTKPGLAWVGPWNTIDGGPPPIAFAYAKRLVKQVDVPGVGLWQIYQVWDLGQPEPKTCLGS